MEIKKTVANRIIFISTLALDEGSGGNIYNSHLINEISGKGIVIDYIQTADVYATLQQIDKNAKIIIDSICLYADVPWQEFASWPITLMIHLPPSLGEAPITLDKRTIVERETLAYRLFPIISAGRFAIDYIQDELKVSGIRHTIVAPGIPSVWRKKTSYSHLPKQILVIGNYSPRKGYTELISLLASLQDLDWQCNMYGRVVDQAYHDSLLLKVKECGLEKRIHVHPPLTYEAVNQNMVEKDLFIQLSKSENNSMIILECIAAGLPFVMTPCGNYKAYQDAGCGLVLEGDHWSDYTEQCSAIMSSENKYQKLVEGLKNYPVHNWAGMANQFLKAIQ